MNTSRLLVGFVVSAALGFQSVAAGPVHASRLDLSQVGTGTPVADDCKPTTPNGRRLAWATSPPSPYWHGNDMLSTELWPNGTVMFRPGGPGFVLKDGALKMKFLWFKSRHPVVITGRRLDTPAQPLRTEVDQGWEAEDFQPSYLIFSTAGCWEVTGQIGDTSLTFVTKVVKVGDGPTNKD